MSFGLARGLCRLSPQIRNVGFQQVRKNSTQEKVMDVFQASMVFGVMGGFWLGGAGGWILGMSSLDNEKTFGGKFFVCLLDAPVMTVVCAGLGAVIVGLWPVTVPVAAFCYLTSEKKGSSSTDLHSRDKLIERKEILTKELSEIEANLSKKA